MEKGQPEHFVSFSNKIKQIKNLMVKFAHIPYQS